MLRPSGALRPTAIEAEVLVLWGEEDPYLGRELAAPSPLWVPRAHVRYFPGAGHFIQHERAKEVNQLLIQFLNGARESGPAPA